MSIDNSAAPVKKLDPLNTLMGVRAVSVEPGDLAFAQAVGERFHDHRGKTVLGFHRRHDRRCHGRRGVLGTDLGPSVRPRAGHGQCGRRHPRRRGRRCHRNTRASRRRRRTRIRATSRRERHPSGSDGRSRHGGLASPRRGNRRLRGGRAAARPDAGEDKRPERAVRVRRRRRNPRRQTRTRSTRRSPRSCCRRRDPGFRRR